MVIDYTINLGTIVQTIVVGAGVIGAFYGMRGDILLLKKDVGYLHKSLEVLNHAFAQISRLLTKVAVQDSRLSSIEKRIEEIIIVQSRKTEESRS